MLNQQVGSRRPAIIKRDNGPEFVAARIQEWIVDRPNDTYFIAVRKPLAERPQRIVQRGASRWLLENRWAFMSGREARLIVENWRGNTTKSGHTVHSIRQPPP
ncbi:MAG: hypothetical protein OSB10_06355, partial [Planctomycetota bacterium]|nr:hypothetical protein [Planctomycetota bacterium]